MADPSAFTGSGFGEVATGREAGGWPTVVTDMRDSSALTLAIRVPREEASSSITNHLKRAPWTSLGQELPLAEAGFAVCDSDPGFFRYSVVNHWR